MKTTVRSTAFSTVAAIILMLATLICCFAVTASADATELRINLSDLEFEGLDTTATGIYTKEYDGTKDVSVALKSAAIDALPEGVTVTPTAVFNSKDVRDASVITVSFELSGRYAKDYIAPRDLTVPAKITPRVLGWADNGSASVTYKVGTTAYSGLAVTLPALDTTNVVSIDGTPEAVSVEGSYTAAVNGVTGAGADTVQFSFSHTYLSFADMPPLHLSVSFFIFYV